MPSRTSVAQRERDYDFSNVGKVGRRTGITLAPRTLDEHGMEEISGLFSSPRKTTPGNKRTIMESVETNMDKTPRTTNPLRTHSTTPGTTTSLRRSNRGTSHPPPRSVSPRKSGITGTARRAGTADALAQKQLQQETEDSLEDIVHAEANDTHLSATPLQTVNPKAVSARPATVRRFSPDRTPLRSRVLNRQSKSAYVGRVSDVQPQVRARTPNDVQEETPSHMQTNNSLQMDATIEDEGLVMDDVNEDEPSIPESDHDVAEPELPAPPPPIDDEDEDQTFAPSARIAGKRAPQNKANSRRKRKSDALDDVEQAAVTSSPAAKRAKRRSNEGFASSQQADKQRARQTDSRKEPARKARKVLATKDPNTKVSARRQKELDDVVEKIRARPGPQKSLYVLRRETPADDNVTRTRSGRVTIKPLAYWRNEGIIYGGGSPSSGGIADGHRFPYQSIKEIVRTEEQFEQSQKPERKGKSKKGKGKARQQAHEDSDIDLDLEGGDAAIDPDADDWELDTGTLKGSVAIWDQDQQAPLDEDEIVDLAHSADAIQTNEVKGSTFRYAKLVSTRFFGTGIVDLPPGGIKKTKNSRKMHMCFFVAQGRVTVVVGPMHGGETRFSIGKGGFWQVPRGNHYSIENEHGKTARIFFSQACEPVPNDLSEE